jgi:hypothetical protein
MSGGSGRSSGGDGLVRPVRGDCDLEIKATVEVIGSLHGIVEGWVGRLLVDMLLLLLLQLRTQPHLGCCLSAATAAASTIFMHLCTSSATP